MEGNDEKLQGVWAWVDHYDDNGQWMPGHRIGRTDRYANPDVYPHAHGYPNADQHTFTDD
jgi:hypothetical protein